VKLPTRGLWSAPRQPYAPVLDDEWIDLPTPAPLIDGLVPARALGFLYGPPASGKSFIALDLAYALANGGEWAGHRVADSVGSRVVYVLAEGSYGFRDRIRSWKDAHPDQPAQLHIVPEPVPIFTVAMRRALEQAQHPLAKLCEHLRAITTPDEGEDEYGASHAVSPYISAIIIDTLSQSIPGADENAASDMSLVIEQLQRLRTDFDCTVIVVHHGNKNRQKVMRGSSVLTGAADFVWYVSKDKGGDIVRVESEKAKDMPEFDPIEFSLVEHAGSLVAQHGTVSPLLERIFGLLVTEHTPKALAVATDVVVRTVQRQIKQLRSKKLIEERTKPKRYVRKDEYMDCRSYTDALTRAEENA
jgi:RecA/RadA recombinase